MTNDTLRLEKHTEPFCSADLENYHPLYLPREFTDNNAMAVYILPQADTKKAINDLH